MIKRNVLNIDPWIVTWYKMFKKSYKAEPAFQKYKLVPWYDSAGWTGTSASRTPVIDNSEILLMKYEKHLCFLQRDGPFEAGATDLFLFKS
jgi:hypothetical protein